MAAAAMLPGDVTDARRVVRSLLLPGLERIHFKSEKDARRRQIIGAMCGLEVQVHVYIAQTKDHVAGRRACMKAILDDVLAAEAGMMTFGWTSQWHWPIVA